MEAKEDKEAVMLELEQLANYKAELHSSCDFVIQGFRQDADIARRRFRTSLCACDSWCILALKVW